MWIIENVKLWEYYHLQLPRPYCLLSIRSSSFSISKHSENQVRDSSSESQYLMIKTAVSWIVTLLHPERYILKFQRFLLPPSSHMIMEAAENPATLMHFYKTTQHHIPGDRKFQSHCSKNFISNKACNVMHTTGSLKSFNVWNLKFC
jgi:hypothetical protein